MLLESEVTSFTAYSLRILCDILIPFGFISDDQKVVKRFKRSNRPPLTKKSLSILIYQ